MNKSDPIDVLARTCWGEARGEGHDGMQAVANVVVNRVSKPRWWGKDVIGVCLHPYQFSCWLKSDPNLLKLSNITQSDPIFDMAHCIAEAAIHGNLVDITNGATSYFAMSSTPPYWAQNRKPCARVGRHIFFEDE